MLLIVFVRASCNKFVCWVLIVIILIELSWTRNYRWKFELKFLSEYRKYINVHFFCYLSRTISWNCFIQTDQSALLVQRNFDIQLLSLRLHCRYGELEINIAKYTFLVLLLHYGTIEIIIGYYIKYVLGVNYKFPKV